MALYAFDGTWHDPLAHANHRNFSKDSNVRRFRLLYRGRTEYVNGVGSCFASHDEFVGRLTSETTRQLIDEQFAALKRNAANGDLEIDIVGYSKGAAIARLFVQRIERDFDQLEHNGLSLRNRPSVRFLGLFDTVAAFGIPWASNNGDYLPDIPELVDNTFHAMALDETRDTFAIDRCFGDYTKIAEVWFRGCHGDIGGNANYIDTQVKNERRRRSDVVLHWLLSKAKSCGLPVDQDIESAVDQESANEAPSSSKGDPITIGLAGTLSRRIRLGDTVHHTLEFAELTRGIDGRMLRRIDVGTRIEDAELEKSRDCFQWIQPSDLNPSFDNEAAPIAKASLEELSLRRYPFDVLPARTWKFWLSFFQLDNPGINETRLIDFWAPCDSDRALAWDVYVELMTRIRTEELKDDEGDDRSALDCVYSLFPLARDYMYKHGVCSANTATLMRAFFNQKVRSFTAKWHKRSVDENWIQHPSDARPEFRVELKAIMQHLRQLADALSHLAAARL